jgi:hypothetical protein
MASVLFCFIDTTSNVVFEPALVWVRTMEFNANNRSAHITIFSILITLPTGAANKTDDASQRDDIFTFHDSTGVSTPLAHP